MDRVELLDDQLHGEDNRGKADYAPDYVVADLDICGAQQPIHWREHPQRDPEKTHRQNAICFQMLGEAIQTTFLQFRCEVIPQKVAGDQKCHEYANVDCNHRKDEGFDRAIGQRCQNNRNHTENLKHDKSDGTQYIQRWPIWTIQNLLQRIKLGIDPFDRQVASYDEQTADDQTDANDEREYDELFSIGPYGGHELILSPIDRLRYQEVGVDGTISCSSR